MIFGHVVEATMPRGQIPELCANVTINNVCSETLRKDQTEFRSCKENDVYPLL